MRGSIIVSYEDLDGFGGDSLQISKNGVVANVLYKNTDELYTTDVYNGDVINLLFTDVPPTIKTYLTIVKREYTADDTSGNDGIIDTILVEDVYYTGYTFTVSVSSKAYDFEIRVSNTSQTQFQIWTEASNPLITQNNEFINQEN